MLGIDFRVPCLLWLVFTYTATALPNHVISNELFTLLARGNSSANFPAKSPFDHDWIDAFVALGDSFAVGLGAGHSVKEAPGLKLNTDCSQYSYGYPNLLNSPSMLGKGNRNFEYLGCSNSDTQVIEAQQISKMSKADVVTLSIGGNDIRFFDIINYCIFQLWTFEWFWSCQRQLDLAKNLIQDGELTKRMTSVIQAVRDKLKDEKSRIYWTGYEHFWNADTKDCDDVTWALSRKIGFREFLTQDHRRQMNELVDLLNGKIKEICATFDRCVFVDSNPQVDAVTGHFCEEGVDEHYHWLEGGVSANRDETFFYEWGTTKDDDTDEDAPVDQPEKRDVPSRKWKADNSTYEGRFAWFIQTALQNGTIDPEIAKDAFPGFSVDTVPLTDYYARIFHRTKFGNGVVAVNVLQAMDVEQGKMMGEPATPTTVTLCPTTEAAATPTVSTCSGNQVQGNCTQASLPSGTPDSGPSPPVCNKVGTNNFVRISDTKAQSAVTEYCSNLVDGKTVIDSKSTAPKPGTVPSAAENGGTLTLDVLFNAQYCDVGTQPADQKLDFGAISKEDCYSNLYTSIAEVCAQDSTWTGYNKDYPLLGGSYGYKCAMWSMSGVKI